MTALSLARHAPASPLARALPYLALAGSVLSVCIGTSFAKQLFPQVGAPATVAYRVGFSALVLLLVFRPWRLRLKRTDMWACVRYGVVLGLMNFSFYMSLRTIPLGLAIAIEFMGPLGVSLYHARRPAHFAVAALAAVGLAILLPIHHGGHALDRGGVAFAACAGVCWGLYIIFGKRTAHLPGPQTVALGMSTAAIIVVPIGLYNAGTAMFTPSLAAIGFVAAVMSSAVPYTLEMIALKRIPANHFGVLMSLEPAVGAIAGGLLLGETLLAQQWLAIALIVAASAGSVLALEKTH